MAPLTVYAAVTGEMARPQRGLGVQLLAVLLLGLVASSSAANCPPGQGVAKTDIMSLLGSLFGRQVAPLKGDCAPCGKSEVSLGGVGAQCVMCTPLLSAPNADHTACECLPGTYAAGAASASSMHRTCVSCGDKAVSVTRNAGSCHACPENARSTQDNKCGCLPGFIATGLGPFGVTGCRYDCTTCVSCSTNCTYTAAQTSALSDRCFAV